MKYGRDILIMFLILANVVGWILFYVNNPASDEKIRTIDIESIYTDFEMTKELDEKYKLKTKIFNDQLDSLDYLIKSKFLNSKNVDQETLIKANIEQNTMIIKQIQVEFETQIWKRIEQYLNEFGDENNLDLIIRKGLGNEVFYSNGDLDITPSAINYLNNKYLGYETN